MMKIWKLHGLVSLGIFMLTSATPLCSNAFAQDDADLHPLIQISCGGTGATPFVADTDYQDGNVTSFTSVVDTSAATNPAPSVVYQAERYGSDFAYSIPVSKPPMGKAYAVRLHFAENYETAAARRITNVSINGTNVISNLDIFATAGGQNKPMVKEFDNIQPGSDGTITIEFTGNSTSPDPNAKVSAIEVFGDGFTPAKFNPLAIAYRFRDTSLPISVRVDDLISHMSTVEKVYQLENNTHPIPRLGVPAYDYWSEGLHGIGMEGIATVFPQAIGMSATWDTSLVHAEGDVVATEARAKFNMSGGQTGDHGTFNGLTIWSPNINIFRDPRWGRGQETYGEDPYLTSRMGVNFIQGLQGSDPQYFKAVACAKHFAVHSGPESERHKFDATPPERDLYETYLPQFEAAVREGHVGQVMSAYTALNGIPCPADKWLLNDLLRSTWHFDGYVVSDCDAVYDVYAGHHFTPTLEAAAADSLIAGTDVCCGGSYLELRGALKDGLVTQAQMDAALHRLFTQRFKLGLFDPPTYAYAKIGASDLDSAAHSALALKAARESIVLLKNDGTLPLNLAKLTNIAVIGANADDVNMLLGNYNGTPSHPITILQGIKDAVGSNCTVTYSAGCPLAGKAGDTFPETSDGYQAALSAAKSADVVIYVGGISPRLEGEEMNVPFEGFLGGDRTVIELPSIQEGFLQALAATGKPIIYVNCSGSSIAMPWENQHLNAIVQAWYPGENGGTAVADVLFGRYNPSGRLPVTFYRATADLPDFKNYSMANRTYRYFTGQPLFPFGHGLSYSKFVYGSTSLSKTKVAPTDTVSVKVAVKNTGAMDGDEVVQVYVHHLKASVPLPIHSLVGFERISIPKGQSANAIIAVRMNDFRYWSVAKKKYVVDPGQYELQIGASSSDIRQKVLITVASS